MSQYNLNRIFKPRHVAVVGVAKKWEPSATR